MTSRLLAVKTTCRRRHKTVMKTTRLATHRRDILTVRKPSAEAKGRTVADFERSTPPARPAAMPGDGAATISAPAELNITTAHEFRLALLASLERNSTLTVDLSRVDLLDPAGAAVLVGAVRRALSAGQELRTRSPSSAAAGALAALGLTRWFGARLVSSA